MALKRITEVTIISSSDVTETPHTFIEHDGAFYRIDSENFQRVFLGGVFRDLEAIIAEDFSPSSTYDVGDLAIYDNKLYECSTAITTAGSWDSSKWTELDLATKITTDKSLALRDRPADAKTVGDAIASTALTIIDPNNDGHLEFVPLGDEWSDEFLEDSVVEATENWLEEHVSSGDIVVDNTLSISGAAADSKKTGDEIESLKSDLSDNIGIIAIAQSDLTNGYFCNQYGLPSANANYTISGYIDISDFAKYGRKIKFPVTLASGAGCVITDVRGIVLMYVNGTNASEYEYTNGYSGYISVSVPTGAKYIRTSIAIADIQTIGTLAVYGELVDGVYDETLSKTITDAIFSGDNFVSPNLWDVKKFDFAGYYGANGTYTATDSYPSLSFTDISDYDLLSIAMGITPQNLLINLVFWDANQSRISGTSANKTAGSTYSSVVEIPKGTKYFTINTRKSENIPQPFEIHAIKKNPLIKGLKGKKLSILGDSISTYTGYNPEGNEVYYTGSNCGVSDVEQTWWKRLIDYCGMELCVNESWSGATISSIRDVSYPNSSGVDRAENLNDGTINPDVIIVYMGTNDFRWNVPLGDYDGSQTFPVTWGNFRAAVAVMLKKILTKYPTAITYICTLKQFEHYNDDNIGFPDKNGIGLTTDDYTEAILDLATLFGVPVIDFNKSGLNYFNLAQYAGDYNSGTAKGLHPNAAGHKKLADRVVHDLINDLT